MFDPFKDFEKRGYLRNTAGEKDLSIVKEVEHEIFRANLDDAIAYLSERAEIEYADFLKVHEILFSGFYPWAGTDRMHNAPELAISKADVMFSHPRDARRAVETGLRMAHDAGTMRSKPGEIMGLFAYGHPFLDGNGRTMLVIHSELCHRAGFAIAWESTSKRGYLTALTDEIAKPAKGILDGYLAPFIVKKLNRKDWTATIDALQGLNGGALPDHIDGDVSDPAVAERYREFEAQRGYQIDN